MKTDINKGYFNSHWPVECGGNRRQKIFDGSLNTKEKSHHLITKVNNRWNVMFISRDDNELYLAGTMPNFIGEKPFGWVQKVNPYNLETICESPNLECGEHIWCGAIAAHANGTIINVNGSFMHILDENCNIIKEIKLPIDQAHNGLLILSDGSIVTKDIRVSNDTTSTLTRLNPESGELIGEPLKLPEGSMGRIACDIDDNGEYISDLSFNNSSLYTITLNVPSFAISGNTRLRIVSQYENNSDLSVISPCDIGSNFSPPYYGETEDYTIFVNSSNSPTNNYVWSNGIIDTIIYNLSPGVYSVSYTDQNGCLSIDSAQVGESALISVLADSNQTICYGGQPNNLISQSFSSFASSSTQWQPSNFFINSYTYKTRFFNIK